MGYAADENYKIQFVSGKVGQALYHNATGTESTTHYLEFLGMEPHPPCFMYPQDCNSGVTFSGKTFVVNFDKGNGQNKTLHKLLS